MEVVFLGVGAGAGALVVWALLRGGREAMQARLDALEGEKVRLEHDVETERRIAAEKARIAEEQARMAEEVRARLGETIETAATRAFTGKNQEFLTLASQRLAPIDERLKAFEEQLRELERTRQGAYGSLTEQLKGLAEAQELLRTETGRLVSALAKPGVRGRWGEMTLRRIVELAGMVEHADFVEQETVEGADGRRRPDLVVKLPGGGSVVVDAKAPFDSYLAAVEATEPAIRESKLDEHARALREHVLALSRKAYWEQFEQSPEFVVLFVPNEAFVAAALEHRPEMFEEAFAARVILATPTNLMALLRVVAFGWRQQTVAESAREISELGRELHKRVAKMAEHWTTLGKRLDGSVKAYNQAVGSLERNVLPQARRFEELGAGSKDDIPEVDGLDTLARTLSAPELTEELDRDRAAEPVVEHVVELDRGVTIDDPDYGTLGRTAEGGR